MLIFWKRYLKKTILTRKKKFCIFILCLLFLIFSDQYIKYLITSNLKLKQSFILVPKILKITYLKNYGAAFSVLFKKTKLLIFFASLIILLFIFYIIKDKVYDKKKLFFVTMIISGGIGNLIDRYFKGYVVDYINLIFWPFRNFAVFNFADCLVVLGSILFLLKYLKDEIFRSGFKNKRF